MMNTLICAFFFTFCSICEGGVTELPSASDDEVFVEVVTEDAWMPSNIFEIKSHSKVVPKKKGKDIGNELPIPEQTWVEDSSPLFKVLRDFLFSGDDLQEVEEHNEDPTEEIVKVLEKGLIEVTTMFLNPPDDEESTITSEDSGTDSISITKIENESTETLFDRIGLNLMNFGSSDKRHSLSITNATTACSTCYNTLKTCVQQCFATHNCHDVQRQARVCPPPASGMCNIFKQWGPVDECREHEDCKSPLLCCSDGCVKQCSDGVWKD